MTVKYTRDLAGERYVTHARFGPVGRDTGRRTVLVNLDSRRRVPRGKGRAADQWTRGYPPGGLKRSIRSEVSDASGNLVGTITADAVRPDTINATSYAASVHEGSERHPILPVRRRWLRWPGPGGRDVFSAGVSHPGTRRGQPFLRDALEAARG